MTWLKFIYTILGLYALYYLANIAWDLLSAKRTLPEGAPELHFSEESVPQKVRPEKVKDKADKKLPAEPVISAVGGVNLKDLFNLAKAEVIAYNKAVSF